MTDQTVNIPLLRKAVEWAEAEAAKPTGGLWIQQLWYTRPGAGGYEAELRERNGLTPKCGTSYCIAGYVCDVEGIDALGYWPQRAAEALGLSESACAPLFNANNTITDVRLVAERLAGERL